MSEKRPYTYVILRYQHDPLSGEFANVGIVLHQKTSGYVGVKVRHTVGRLSKMFPDLDGASLRESLKAVERGIQRLARKSRNDLLSPLSDAGSYARYVLPEDDTSLVWGPIGSGVARDASKTLEDLFDRFVARYDERHVHHRDDAAVWKPVKDRLAQEQLADCLRPKTIVSPVDRVEFAHAWKNGVWHCYQPLSFDLANEETIREKARRWAGTMLALKDSAEPFKPHFFVGLPTSTELSEAYRAAIRILQLSPGEPQIIEETKIDDLVRQIENEIRAHRQSGS